MIFFKHEVVPISKTELCWTFLCMLWFGVFSGTGEGGSAISLSAQGLQRAHKALGPGVACWWRAHRDLAAAPAADWAVQTCAAGRHGLPPPAPPPPVCCT